MGRDREEEGGGRSVTLTFQPAAPHKENYQTDAGAWSNTSDISALYRAQKPLLQLKSNATMQNINLQVKVQHSRFRLSQVLSVKCSLSSPFQWWNVATSRICSHTLVLAFRVFVFILGTHFKTVVLKLWGGPHCWGMETLQVGRR